LRIFSRVQGVHRRVTGIGADGMSWFAQKTFFLGSRVKTSPTVLATNVRGIVKNGDNPHPVRTLLAFHAGAVRPRITLMQTKSLSSLARLDSPLGFAQGRLGGRSHMSVATG